MELQNEIGDYILQNIYNVNDNPKQFLFVFNKSSKGKKILSVNQDGWLHLTKFDRMIAQSPSAFVSKLRKFIRLKRVTGIKQIFGSKSLVLQFINGMYFLIFDFFNAGNIFLLDKDRKIIGYNRNVLNEEKKAKYETNNIYEPLDKNLFINNEQENKKVFINQEILDWILKEEERLKTIENIRKDKLTINKFLFVNTVFFPKELIYKHLIKREIDCKLPFTKFKNEKDIKILTEVLNNCQKEYEEVLSNINDKFKGYIISSENDECYEQFHPFEPNFLKSDQKLIEISGYNDTLDKFFSSLESSKNVKRIDQQKLRALKRIDKTQMERDEQMRLLKEQEMQNLRIGELIIRESSNVDSCIKYIKNLISQQFDWDNIEKQLKFEQSKKKNFLSLINLPLKINVNKIDIILPIDEFEFDSDEFNADLKQFKSETAKNIKDKIKKKKNSCEIQNSDKFVIVEVDLNISSYANADLYFIRKKESELKHSKVFKKSDISLKNTEKKVNKDLKNLLKDKSVALTEIRDKIWFENFYWFISLEGYLCLAGKNDVETDMIYYRYFGDNDYFVSSDVENSLKVFVKNHYPEKEVPPTTLTQAGIFALSTSKSWDNKTTCSPWYLKGNMVSKKEYDNTLLALGLFNYYDEKNYLPPVKMVMGIGVYFICDEETANKYRKLRFQKYGNDLDAIMNNQKEDLNVNKKKILELFLKIEEKESIENDNDKKLNKSLENNYSLSEDIINNADENNSNSVSINTNLIPIISSSNKHKTLPRGKKSKLKKIATKYANQDDDERKARLSLLGTLKQIEKNKFNEQTELIINNNSKLKKTVTKKKIKKVFEFNECKKYFTDNDNVSNVAFKNYHLNLDSFVPKIDENDSVLGIITFFAPWISMKNFKYKVKIQPGKTKKEKCANEVLNYLKKSVSNKTLEDKTVIFDIERSLISSLNPNKLLLSLTNSKLRCVNNEIKKN